MSEWKPIESAPKDGSEILGWRADCGVILIRYTTPEAFLSERELEELSEQEATSPGWFCADWISGCLLDGDETPTHWMELPEPPK